MTNQQEVVADALPGIWRERAARKRQCGLSKEAELDEIHATELEAALATLPTREIAAAKRDGASVYHLLRSIRYNANFGSQDRPLHHRLNLIAKDAQDAIDAVEAAALRTPASENKEPTK